MKKKLTLVTFAAAFAAMFGMDLDMAAAQFGAGPRLGNQVAEPDSFRRVATDLNVGLPGRIWIETNFADEGLGYNGSYFSVGGKTRVGEDFLDGRWLTEARLHHSLEEDGGFFANIGIERVFSIKSAGADIVTGFWYDYDGDEQGNFGNSFNQLGINAAIRTRRWDLVGNGYFSIGESDFSSGVGTFIGNNIQINQGIDSALTGFDVGLKLRPKQLAFMNGSFEIGGYGYSSDLVNSFGGGRIRLGAQSRRGVSVGLELNHDDRFRTTGLINLGYVFGSVGGRGGEYSSLGNDLQQTNRNDHIVRFNQDIKLAIDPETGAPFNVIFVDNTADGTNDQGTAESPFDALIDAELNSSPGDIIYVFAGDGTDNLYNQGINLQNNQQLLSGGTQNLLLTQNCGLFELTEGGGIAANLSNVGANSVVNLADNNIVSGVNIDATGANFGILGNNIDGGATIRSTNVSGANLDGILTQNFSGPLTIENTTASNNGRDGIHANSFNSDQITLSSNTTNGNTRHGVNIENDLDTANGEIDITSSISNGNTGFGVLVSDGGGNLNIVDSTIENNIGGGIKTWNYVNGTGQQTFIGTTDGGVSSVSNNLVGANIEFDLDGNGLEQNILVTGLTVDNGGRGIVARTDGRNTVMNIDIIDNDSISDNDAEGILLVAEGSSVINTNIAGTDTAQLISGNGIISGAAINLEANNTNTLSPASEINSIIDNLEILLPGNSSGGDGIRIASNGNAFATSEISNVDIERNIIGDDAIPNNFDVNDLGLIAAGEFGIALEFANDGNQNNVNRINISNATIETDNGILVDTEQNTLTDVTITDSLLQAVGPRAVGRDDGLDDPTNNNFGDIGIQISANGTEFNPNEDNQTRVTIERTLIQDFSGPGGPLGIGRGDPGFNGLGEALPGSAVDAFATGDANLLLTLSSNRILNNGAGYNFDTDGDGFFGEEASDFSIIDENPNAVLFHDAVRVSGFDSSTISTRIVGNFFQDNFERAISIDTYDNATLNAQVVSNSFDNNDRGDDPGRDTFRSNPEGLDEAFNSTESFESQIFDFEAINNEEFFQRFYESSLGISPGGDNSGDIIDDFPFDDMGEPDGDDIADLSFNNPLSSSTFVSTLTPGFAQLNLDLTGNSFEFGTLLADFATAPGDFTLSGAAGFGTTPGANGFADQLIQNEESMFNQTFGN